MPDSSPTVHHVDQAAELAQKLLDHIAAVVVQCGKGGVKGLNPDTYTQLSDLLPELVELRDELATIARGIDRG